MSKIIMIAGPTGVGKTSLSIQLAKKINGEIICADSMQIYKGMDIGTAKVTKDEACCVPHHMIDIITPFESFTVSDYSLMCKKIIGEIIERGKVPLMVGGTGLYFNSILYDMDFGLGSEYRDGRIEVRNSDIRNRLEREAELKGSLYVHSLLKKLNSDVAERIHPNNLRRVIRAVELISNNRSNDVSIGDLKNNLRRSHYDVYVIGLNADRKLLYDRINTRVDTMISNGLIDEVKGLADSGLDTSYQSMKGIGYKEIYEYLTGNIGLEDAVEILKRNSRRYAKRQFTWFKRYDFIDWIDTFEADAADLANRFF